MNAISERKPDVVIVQLPQGPLLLEAIALRAFKHFKLIADVHTGFLMRWEWKSLFLNTPFKRLLGSCDAVIIHNEKMRELLPEKAKPGALVVYDPWFMIKPVAPQAVKEKYLVFPASYHPDEPLDEVLSAAKELCPDINIKVTGNWRRRPDVRKHESQQITFTGYLTDAEYELIIANSSGIISGTKEEYTALMSGWEAVAYSKPLIISTTATLKEVYGDYPHYYDISVPKTIAWAINQAVNNLPTQAERESLRLKATLSLQSMKHRF